MTLRAWQGEILVPQLDESIRLRDDGGEGSKIKVLTFSNYCVSHGKCMNSAFQYHTLYSLGFRMMR